MSPLREIKKRKKKKKSAIIERVSFIKTRSKHYNAPKMLSLANNQLNQVHQNRFSSFVLLWPGYRDGFSSSFQIYSTWGKTEEILDDRTISASSNSSTQTTVLQILRQGQTSPYKVHTQVHISITEFEQK